MSNVLERGEIFFFYRPRVDAEAADELEDVQRFFFVLEPSQSKRFRRIVVGRKRLPDPETHEREWAFVAEVADDPEQIRDDIEAKTYETKTRGTRTQPAARPAGEGRYSIVDHDGHTHLAYVLELPQEPGEVQRAFGIEKEASYVVAVRNPDAPAPPGVGLAPHRRAAFPKEVLDRFGRRRFVPLIPPSLLDYEGAEIVLIGAARDVSAELGIELDADRERLETADIFRDLRLPPEALPVEPLVEGRWQ
jgi:hypothetical protein